MLTIKAALEEATHAIGRVDAQVLMAHLLGVNRAYLAAHPMRVLTESEDARVDMYVAQRAMGQPVAYLIGRREFYSREFEVSPDVLIPRPETETLVEEALEACRPRADGGPTSVLDLGTGSGILAITLACELPVIAVTATDTSATALDLARRNAASLGAQVEFLEGSWYAPVPGRRFDCIVSNPPYIAAADPHLGAGDLRFEPAQALTDGSADGLDSIRAITRGAREHLKPGGWLLLEHGYDQQGAVAKILAEAGFGELASIPDLAGIPRVAGGKIE
ncbi:MAG TPA: peptide chain release factor N(5)-glutamine methyltransferase [Usitatibacter sp.]|nr:peptide chain release factor N(5)-glutamine methyltransferase [Usitatibacter sp.]